jgi:hypothetical protein
MNGDSIVDSPHYYDPWLSFQSNGSIVAPAGADEPKAEGEWNAVCQDSQAVITVMNTATLFDGDYHVWSENGGLRAQSRNSKRTIELLYTPTILDQLEYR